MRPSRRWWRVALQRLHVLGRHQLRDQRWGPSGREPRTPRVVAARMQGRAGVGCDAAMKGQGGAGVAGEDVAITSPANHDHHMLPHTPAALSSPRSGSAMWRCRNAVPPLRRTAQTPRAGPRGRRACVCSACSERARPMPDATTRSSPARYAASGRGFEEGAANVEGHGEPCACGWFGRVHRVSVCRAGRRAAATLVCGRVITQQLNVAVNLTPSPSSYVLRFTYAGPADRCPAVRPASMCEPTRVGTVSRRDLIWACGCGFG